jgi:hypothetical protein
MGTGRRFSGSVSEPVAKGVTVQPENLIFSGLPRPGLERLDEGRCRKPSSSMPWSGKSAA